MFITRKELQRKIDEAVCAARMETDKMLAQQREQEWQEQRERDRYADYARHFESLERRIVALEKKAGIYEERNMCPMMATPVNG